ncbi:hypothetical protein SVIOM74S_08913 [Streptomyces violarus]
MFKRLPGLRRARFGNRGHREDLAVAGTARSVGCQGAHWSPPGPRPGPCLGGSGEGHGRTDRAHPPPRTPRGPPDARRTPGVRGPHRSGKRLAARRDDLGPRAAPRPRFRRTRPGRAPLLRRGARRTAARRRAAHSPRLHQRQARPLLRPPRQASRGRTRHVRGRGRLGGHPSGWSPLLPDGARAAVRIRVRPRRGAHPQGGSARCAGGADRRGGVPGQLGLGTARSGGRARRAHQDRRTRRR